MITRGRKLLKLVLNKEGNGDVPTSSDGLNIQCSTPPLEPPEDNCDVPTSSDVLNIQSSTPPLEPPLDVCSSTAKTIDWINQSNFDDGHHNKLTDFKEKFENVQPVPKPCGLIACNCSHISGSEPSVDDSYLDRDFIPNSDDTTSTNSEVSYDLTKSVIEEGNENYSHGKLANIRRSSIIIHQDVSIFTKHTNSGISILNNLPYTGDTNLINDTLMIDKRQNEHPSPHVSADARPQIEDNVREPLSNVLKRLKKNQKKVVHCKFCQEDINTLNFMRHVKRNHGSEQEVHTIFQLPKNSKERRRAFAILRNDTNFELFINGNVRPNRKLVKEPKIKIKYYPCAYCKGIFARQYLKRHVKSCFLKDSEKNQSKILSLSQTVTACAMDPTNVLSKLNVKEQVFDIMKPDDIAFEAKKDLLIANFGESYLKKHRRERMAYSCSNRMRELSRILLNFRMITNNNKANFKDILHPKHFDTVLMAVRKISGFDHEKKSFQTPSLAMHLGTSLKLACDELTHLVLKQSKGFRCKSAEDAQVWLTNIKNFKKLVESRWTIEISSLANKDLQEKRWKKPLLLPLVSDVKKFRDEVTKLANDSVSQLLLKENKRAFKLLIQCVLSLLILFNRRRIGDVQYLKISDYKSDKKSNYTDFDHVLTDVERSLTQKYKRVLNSGKGSRAVVILIPEELQNMINVLLAERNKYILDSNNDYVFAMPDSTIKWGKGDVAIRALCKKIQIENPKAISSNNLRKQIATVTQILSLKPEEAKQFANFMGHTQKTHDEFYELPVDIYQTAKVSKLLMMMEKGSMPIEYKGKSLEEIIIDFNLEYAEEDKIDGTINKRSEEPPGFYANERSIEIVNTGFNDVNDRENRSPCSSPQEELSSDITVAANERSRTVPQIPSDLPIHASPKTSRIVQDRPSDLIDADSVAEVPKRSGQRTYWSNRELHLLKKEFSVYINKGTYPAGNDIKEFLERNGINRSVIVTKSKLQHLIKTKKGL
ncbi:uncharacterized protein LOC116159286 isoform X1 [Photinus pyralis]|uniref:uncharacterized protein LOC116159286 isoform X1 n=1 Tax=Photinus pyralis TaxID=7054 RepID=UPI0012670204|nr:uncharacterized protein LOC116159286 isoform X1 [Photinus pyralis]